MKEIIVFLLAMLSLSGSGTAATPVTVRGAVMDVEGAAIGGAKIVIRFDRSGQMRPVSQTLVQLSTDRMGTFSSQLQPGFYDVCVMANAFTPQCQKILVKSGSGGGPVFHLKTDDLISKSIGDSFQ
jgi:hypothetical protein